MLHIFWHTHPDTDAICSAVVAADFYNRIGIDAKAFRLGKINNETEYVFARIDIDVPPLLGELGEPIEVVLVDHNSPHQSHPNLNKQRVKGFIDHHTIENLNTDVPTFMRFEPYCSTCTILYEMYQEKNVQITDEIAILMLAGILSDSLAFRSPTTTDHDVEVAESLAKQLAISDIQSYAKKMFDAKSDLGDIPVRDLVTMDYKEFEFWGKKLAIWVIETTNPGYTFDRKSEVLEDMKKIKEETSLDLIFLSVVDILREHNTTLVVWEEEASIVSDAFDATTIDHEADLGKRVSRKKQLVPELKEYFSE